jgi:hypothetical protein
VQLGQRARELSDEGREHTGIRSLMILALVGLGRFELAMETIGTEESVLASDQPDDVFNFAIAKWGLEGKPSPVLFEHAAALIIRRFWAPPDANTSQCLALSQMVLGQHDAARSSLEFSRSRARSGQRAFSCWRYLDVTGREMLRDLEAMEKVVDTSPVPEPEFFAEARKLV